MGTRSAPGAHSRPGAPPAIQLRTNECECCYKTSAMFLLKYLYGQWTLKHENVYTCLSRVSARLQTCVSWKAGTGHTRLCTGSCSGRTVCSPGPPGRGAPPRLLTERRPSVRRSHRSCPSAPFCFRLVPLWFPLSSSEAVQTPASPERP